MNIVIDTNVFISALIKDSLTREIIVNSNHMRIIAFEEICNKYNEAYEIMNNIDPDDVIFIATALMFKAIIWSDDQHFKMQDRIKSITTMEIKNLQD